MGTGIHRAGRPDQRLHIHRPYFDNRTGLHHDRMPSHDRSPYQGRHTPYPNPGSFLHRRQVLLLRLLSLILQLPFFQMFLPSKISIYLCLQPVLMF